MRELEDPFGIEDAVEVVLAEVREREAFLELVPDEIGGGRRHEHLGAPRSLFDPRPPC